MVDDVTGLDGFQRCKVSFDVAAVELAGVRLGDDHARHPEALLHLEIVSDRRQFGNRRPACLPRKARQIDMDVAVGGAGRRLEPRRLADEGSRVGGNGSRGDWSVRANSVSVARLISMPRPGPAGMATTPFACSMGVSITAWRKGLGVRSNSSMSSIGSRRGGSGGRAAMNCRVPPCRRCGVFR